MDPLRRRRNPVEHSQSPFIHAMFARRPASRGYDRLLCPLDGFARRAALRRRGRRGCNVTVPFKFDAFAWPRAQRRAPRWRRPRTRCASTRRLVRRQHRRRGLVRDIERNAGVALAGGACC
jgi:shikimate dehydrogenase